MEQLTLSMIAKMIDHALLHPTLTDDDILRGCQLAKKHNVATACVKPYCIQMAKEVLLDSEVGICPVIGFPHGNSKTSIKVKEAETAVLDGGQEIDMVVNIGKVLGGNWEEVSQEIKEIQEVVTSHQAILKVIFETDYLQDEQIVRLCEICSQHEVAFVKTSSGFGFVQQENGMYSYQGATTHHLQLMRKHAAVSVQIKASGGIRTLDQLLLARQQGATRIGTSATDSILAEAKKRGCPA